jgi:hypothetical protein
LTALSDRAVRKKALEAKLEAMAAADRKEKADQNSSTGLRLVEAC